MQRLLVARELAELLRVHEVDIYYLVKNAGLPVVRVGKRRLRFDPAEVAKWLRGPQRESERSA